MEEILPETAKVAVDQTRPGAAQAEEEQARPGVVLAAV
jgi:hypothetical protein